MSRRYASIRGEIIPAEEAKVSILDRALLYGDGLFETIRACGGKAVRIDAHLERLARGMRVLGFPKPPRTSEIKTAIAALLDANGMANARIRLTVTRGLSAGPGRLTESGGPPFWALTCDDLPSRPSEPASVIFASIRRDERSPLSALKSLNYLPSVLARLEAEHLGADDAVLLNNQGRVSDGTVGNVFVVKGTRLLTPSLEEGPLPGTVRAALIDMAPSLGLEVEETAVQPEDLLSADEVFFTNAIQLVRPVSRIGNTELPCSHSVAERVLKVLLRTHIPLGRISDPGPVE